MAGKLRSCPSSWPAAFDLSRYFSMEGTSEFADLIRLSILAQVLLIVCSFSSDIRTDDRKRNQRGLVT